MKRAMPLLLVLALSALAACKDELTGPSEGLTGEIRADRPPGAGPPPGGPQSSTISGRKFHDLDADGTDDGGSDPGLSGWTILVYADVDKDGVRDVSEFASGPVAIAVTDSAGGYGLTVNPGRYIVCEVMEPAWSQSAPANSICAPDPGAAHGGYAVMVTGRSSSTGMDFGNFQLGTVGGRKFDDLDGDGTDDGGTDPDLSGWTIRAYEDTDEDGVLDFAEFDAGAVATDVTDPNGEYELTLIPGKYLICEVAQLVGGFIVWHQSLPRGPEASWGPHLPPADLTCAAGASAGDLMSGGYAVTMASGGDETGRDFGNYLKGSVSGRKFNDNDQDGTDDGGTDPGLSGWLIFAFFDADGDGVLDASEIEDFGLQGQDETNANGEYEFTVHPGRYIVCEVQEDGWAQSEPANTICAGAESPGFPHAPGGLVVTVTSGGTHTGNDFGNFEGSPPPVAEFQSISAGGQHTCGVTTAGDAFCWGDNHAGQLGDGNAFTNSDTPVLVVGGHVFESVSAGETHTCGLTAAGDAFCWGDNNNGRLGDGNAPTDSDIPVAVVGGHIFQSISAGRNHSCGLTTDGDTYCWGSNGRGQLGDGNAPTDSDIPVLVGGAPVFQSIGAGGLHTCGLTTAGEAYCWGDNTAGQLGDGNASPTYSDTPVAVVGGHVFQSIGTGLGHTCGVTAAGEAWCWGHNDHGQLGDGNAGTYSDTPVAVLDGHVFQSISAGFDHTCGVTTAGDAFCWGENNRGELGDGNAPTASSTPVLVLGGHVFQSTSTGSAHTCGVTAAGDGYCWGANGAGQLGDGNAGTDSDTPVGVAAP